jgi:hypothetical protein
VDQVGETDRVKNSVGALGKFDGGSDVDRIAVGDTVRQQDERLAAGLLLHHLFGTVVDRAEDERGVSSGNPELAQGRGQFGPGSGEALHDPDTLIEVGHEGAVLAGAKNAVEKRAARAALLLRGLRSGFGWCRPAGRW